jgi:hypothetical protein
LVITQDQHCTQVAGDNARFIWERAVRDSDLPAYLTGFLLLVGTYMSNDGTNAYPSVEKLCGNKRYSRKRVLELFKMANDGGWIITVKRSNRSSIRLPAIPYCER